MSNVTVQSSCLRYLAFLHPSFAGLDKQAGRARQRLISTQRNFYCLRKSVNLIAWRIHIVRLHRNHHEVIKGIFY